jgi:hypothetical protein
LASLDQGTSRRSSAVDILMGSLQARWISALTFVAFATALPAGLAAADVGRFDLRPRAAAPGSSVEFSFAAAWPQRFPISLVRLARAPEPFPCHGGRASARRRPWRHRGVPHSPSSDRLAPTARAAPAISTATGFASTCQIWNQAPTLSSSGAAVATRVHVAA